MIKTLIVASGKLRQNNNKTDSCKQDVQMTIKGYEHEKESIIKRIADHVDDGSFSANSHGGGLN